MAKLQKAALRGLHPTQLTVGMIVVRDKKKHLAQLNAAQQQDFLQAHPMRHYYACIPQHLDRLVDDPYRSLAGDVRDAGGYDKTPTAFAEFIWADFLRRNVPIEDLQSDFKAAVQVAVPLAQSHLANGIPGFKGK